MAPSIKVYYFDIAGRAEPIRLALGCAGLPFEDVRLSREQFGELKKSGKFPNGQVPFAEIDGKPLAQTNAILRYVGKLGNLYPQDAWEAAKVDEALYWCDDVGQAIGPSFRESDQEKKMALRKTLAEETLPLWLGYFAKRLESNGTNFAAGNNLTVADLGAFQMLNWISSGILDGIPTTILDGFPAVKSYLERVKNHPGVKKYYDSKTLKN